MQFCLLYMYHMLSFVTDHKMGIADTHNYACSVSVGQSPEF